MRLICIDDETDILNFGDGVKELTYGKEYQINSHYDSTNGKRYYSILNDKGVRHGVEKELFIDIAKIRQDKIKELGI